MQLNRDHYAYATLALIATLALGACGKSEPATTAKQAPLEAAADKAPATPTATPASQKAAVPTAAPAKSSASAAVTRVDLPNDVVAVIGLRSLDAVLTAAKTALEQLDPTSIQPGFISATKEGIKESLGWKDIGWVKPDQPIRSILFNAKQYQGKAQFLAFPMTNKDAVLAALPDGAKQKDGEHAAVYENNGQVVFVDFIDDHAIYTDHPAFLAQGKELFTKTLRDWVPTRDVQLKLDLDNIYSLYMVELTESKRQILASYTTGDSSFIGVDKIVAWQLGVLFELLESSHQCDLDLWLDNKTLHGAASFIPKEGTALHTFTKTNKGKLPSFAQAAPASGYVNAVLNFDLRQFPALMTQLNEATVEVYKNLADLRDEDIAKIRTQLELIAKHSPGDAMFSAYVDGEFPVAVGAVARLTDTVTVKAAYGAIIQTVFERMAAKMDGGAGAAAKMDKPYAALATMLNEMGIPLGAKVALVDEKTADGVSLAGLRFNVDWARFAATTGLDKTDPELFKTLTGSVGASFEAILAIKGDLCAVAFGPKGLKVATDLASGKTLGTSEPGLARLAKNHAGAMSFRFDTILKALSVLPVLAGKRDVISKMPVERPLTATLNSDGTATTVSVGIPLDVMQVLGAIEK